MNRLVIGPYQALTKLTDFNRLVVAPLNCRWLSLSAINRGPEDFRPSEDLAKERYDLRAGEETEKKRARLLYQSRKRGMLENGVILASFANKYLDGFDADQLDQYDKLINLPTNDWDIFHWATKTKPTPAEFETPIMQQLRDHINSKVSKDTVSHPVPKKSRRLVSYLNKKPDDLVMPVAKKEVNLDIDPRSVDFTNYAEELYDDRIKRFPKNQYVKLMTNWRREYFVRRLKRTISAPISVRNLSEDRVAKVYSQKAKEKNIANSEILQTDLIESANIKKLKHHNFLQHLLSSNFTDDALEYDDEAEAWANMLWHREYGSADVTVAPSSLKCFKCEAIIHCCDHGLQGYVPREVFASLVNVDKATQAICQRCKFSKTYNAELGADVSKEKFVKMLRSFQYKPAAIVCLLVDLTDFPGSIWEGIINEIGVHHRIIIIGNKLDLLPSDGTHMLGRVKYSLSKSLQRLRPNEMNLFVRDVLLLSARTGFGINSLVTRLLELSEVPKDIYLLGCSNSGKATLFNALLQSDLSAIREGDLLSRVSVYKNSDSDLSMLKFPIQLAEGWEVELKKRRMERVERDFRRVESSLENMTQKRQATMPHMSLLADRIDYPSLSSSSEIQTFDDKEVKFTEDHPLANMTIGEPLSATEDRFIHNKFFYYTPSASQKDQMHDLLTSDEKLEVFPDETIIPRKYTLRPLQSLFISGLARIDLLTANTFVVMTIFTSKYLPVHVIPTRKADHFYYTFLGSPYLGVPFGDEQRMKAWPKLKNSKPDFLIKGISMRQGAADIVLSSIGWALLNLGSDQDCIVRAFTPEGRGIFLRDPPLLPFATKEVRGKKMRDTPLFEHLDYKNELLQA